MDVSRRLSRRSALRFGALGLLPLLAACSAPAPTAAPAKPTEAPAKPTEAPKPAAAAPTTAPAAAPAATTAPAAAATQPAAAATTAPAAAAKPTEAPAAAKPAAGGQVVNLRAAYWSSSPEDHNVFEAVFKLFNEKNPNIRVTFDDVPSDGFDAKMQTEIAAGTPADTMELHPAWVLRFITGKRLNDLTDRMKEDRNLYIPAQLDFWVGPDQKLYGLPYYSGPSFVFYNKTLFKKVGAKTPEEHEKEGTWTWETLRKLAQQTTTGSGAERTFGWDGRDVGNMQFYFAVPVWDNGAEMINKEETAWLVDQPGVVEVAQMHADMFLKDKSIPLPADVQGISWLFRTGRVGMAWAGKFRSIELTNAEFEVGHVGTPKGKVGPINRDGPNASGLPVGTKYVDQAYQVGKFFGGPEAAPAYLASGRPVPVQKTLLDSDAFKKALKPYERLEVYQQAINSVRAWRVPGRAPEINRAWQTEWDKVLVGQQDVPTAMKNAKAAMDPLLR
jgi:multiple sugar transport system substrate-binding protein